MELLDVERSIVVVIDMQGKLMDLVHRPQVVRAAARQLLLLADLYQVPVVLTEQYPRGLGSTHPELLATFDELTTQRRLVQKESFGCCGERTFEAALLELRPELEPRARQLVVGGIEAHICVVQTVLEVLAQQSQVHLCWECISSRGEEYREWALERMARGGAVVNNLESVGFEWARDKNHPRFKAMSALFKEGQVAGVS